jgi:hypothetical protein
VTPAVVAVGEEDDATIGDAGAEAGAEVIVGIEGEGDLTLGLKVVTTIEEGEETTGVTEKSTGGIRDAIPESHRAVKGIAATVVTDASIAETIAETAEKAGIAVTKAETASPEDAGSAIEGGRTSATPMRRGVLTVPRSLPSTAQTTIKPTTRTM